MILSERRSTTTLQFAAYIVNADPMKLRMVRATPPCRCLILALMAKMKKGITDKATKQNPLSVSMMTGK